MKKIETRTLSLQDCIVDVIDNRGVTPHKRGIEWQDHGIPVLSANNIKTTGIQNVGQIRFIPESAYDSWMKMPLEKGDVILTSEAPAGEVFYWDSDEKIVLGQRLYGLKIKKEISSLYLKYYLQSDKGQAEIRNKCSGSTVFGISAKTFSSIEIILPVEKSIQEKIGNVLKSIDDKIENNKKISEELNKYVTTLYNYWFLQYDFPDENGKPYKSSGGKLEWNDELKRKIPEKWEVEPIGKHTHIVRGISYTSEDLEGEGIPMINLNSFNTDASYKPEGLKTYAGELADDRKIYPNDLVICITQQTAIDLSGATNVIGKAMIVPDIFEGDIAASMDVMKLECDDIFGPLYLMATINHPSIHKYIVGFANGTKIKHLDVNGLLEMKHEVPPTGILRKYNKIAWDVEKKKSEIIAENDKLMALREYLLPLLINGQVGVK